MLTNYRFYCSSGLKLNPTVMAGSSDMKHVRKVIYRKFIHNLPYLIGKTISFLVEHTCNWVFTTEKHDYENA